MLKWIIIVTFAASSMNANEPAVYTKTPYAKRMFTQAVVDTKGRLIWFDNLALCKALASRTIDNMLQDPATVPVSAKCKQVEIQE